MGDVPWLAAGGYLPTRNPTDDDLPNLSPQHRASSTSGDSESRQSFQRMSSYKDDTDSCTSPHVVGYSSKMMDGLSSDGFRTEAMAEGSRMLIESLREKVTSLEDKCERTDRERRAVNELLTVKKAQLADERERFELHIDNLNDELQRVKSEKVSRSFESHM
jgi:hypothetical protein